MTVLQIFFIFEMQTGYMKNTMAFCKDDLSDVAAMVLRNVVGKEVVETMSPEFVGFIKDA